MPWYPTGSKTIVSVSDISVVNLIASRAVGVASVIMILVVEMYPYQQKRKFFLLDHPMNNNLKRLLPKG